MHHRYPIAAVTILCACTAIAACGSDALETTPARSEYFSWINHTNEGPTEAQTLANLDFFRWLHDEYGMTLDIYAFDAGVIDGATFYGTTKSGRFKRNFPHGFDLVAKRAAETNTRLGIWGGPDGFGHTPEEEAARIEDMVSLCRDYNWALFKMDAVCGQLRPEKYDAFDRMMTACRKYSPDLILLNHRLDLGPGTRHSSTYLLGGAETYIDVFMSNHITGTHHRVGALSRELPPGLTRLTEDCGVCISSCIDYWEDDLVLQGFARNLLVAPQVYGSPWLMRDDEFPRFANIFNLHRQYRDIMVRGLVLPENQYGSGAVSRGDAKTRLITLRNLTWEPVTVTLWLDDTIGLAPTRERIRVTQLHPFGEDQGEFAHGAATKIEVLPFRACLLRVTSEPATGWEIKGARYDVVRDIPSRPVALKLLGAPGERARVSLASGANAKFRSATLDGQDASALLRSEGLEVTFTGQPWNEAPHRRLAVMQPADVPADAESLYEATCYAGDNNALEVRSIQRSGATKIPAVQRARDAFFGQPLFLARGIWDRNLFDGDAKTGFAANMRWFDPRIKEGAFRLDLGEVRQLDELVIETSDIFALQPLKPDEGVIAQFSADLKTWHEHTFLAGITMRADLRRVPPWRYMRFIQAPLKLTEVTGYVGGQPVDRSRWRVSTLFAPWVEWHWREASIHRARKAWTAKFIVNEIPRHSYLCVAINGQHGIEGATAAFRIGGRYVGAPDRAPSFVGNTWELNVRPADRNYTYYLPLTPDLAGQEIEAVVLAFDPNLTDLKPEVWITAYPTPFEEKTLVLERGPVSSPQ